MAQVFLDAGQEFKAQALDPQSCGSGATNGTTIDTADKVTGPLNCILNVGAFSGTNPTLDVKVQQGAKSDASDMADITGATFTQATAAGIQAIQFLFDKRYVRVVATVGGTSTPTALASATFLGQPRSSGGATGYSNYPSGNP